MIVRATKAYVRKANRLLSDEEQARIVDDVTASPDIHPVVQGTGGVRKMRARLGGRGKSGGVRVMYFYRSHVGTIYLLTLFAKNEQDNLSTGGKRELRELVKRIDELETTTIRS